MIDRWRSPWTTFDRAACSLGNSALSQAPRANTYPCVLIEVDKTGHVGMDVLGQDR